MAPPDSQFDWDRYEAELSDPPATESPPVPALPTPSAAGRPAGADLDGAGLLDRVRAALCRFLIMPSPEATDAVVLWIAATHAQPAWEHATRLSITGPAKRCGKSRLLEIIKATSYRVLPAVNARPAALYRSIDSDDPPTILLDEFDTLFGTKRVAEANEDLRALLNAGHSRGWPILRCVGPNQHVVPFQSFAMAALAGIGALPDTIADRAVNIRMRRRAPHEEVESYRIRRNQLALHELRDQLTVWMRAHLDQLSEAVPEMPVDDRAADTWESLIAVADLAGGTWPERARTACVVLTRQAAEADTDLGTRLLADLHTVFTGASKLHTATILDRLKAIEDAPWAELELTAHHLAGMLRDYNITSKDVRETGTGPARKGYDRADLADAFARYLRTPVADVADPSATTRQNATGLSSHVADVADVAAPDPDPDPTPPGEDPPGPADPDQPPPDRPAEKP